MYGVLDPNSLPRNEEAWSSDEHRHHPSIRGRRVCDSGNAGCGPSSDALRVSAVSRACHARRSTPEGAEIIEFLLVEASLKKKKEEKRTTKINNKTVHEQPLQQKNSTQNPMPKQKTQYGRLKQNKQQQQKQRPRKRRNSGPPPRLHASALLHAFNVVSI